jgi:hypothetical protein
VHPLMNLAFVNSKMDKASCCLLQSHQPPWFLGFVCTVLRFSELKLLVQGVPLTEQWRGAAPMTKKSARTKKAVFVLKNKQVSPVSFHPLTVSTYQSWKWVRIQCVVVSCHDCYYCWRDGESRQHT